MKEEVNDMVKYYNSTSHRGHNAIVPGASGNGLKEHEVAQKIHDLFRKATGAVDATDNVGRTVNDNLYNIVRKMNAVGKSYHVSHHLNAFNGTANGFEVWYHAGNAAAKKLATEICTAVCAATGWANRGAKATTDLYVIRASVGSAILIEWGFIDSKKDMDIMAKKMEAGVNAALKVMGYGATTGSTTPVKPKPTTPSKPSKPSKPATSKPSYTQLTVDGSFGPATAKRLQQYFGTTQDGVISHQYRQKYNQNIHAAKFDNTLIGSNVVRALQKMLKINQDGLMGQATIKALQKRFGTTQDGIVSAPTSEMVKELQRRLNKNKL